MRCRLLVSLLCVLPSMLLPQTGMADAAARRYTDPREGFSLHYGLDAAVIKDGQRNVHDALIQTPAVLIALDRAVSKGTNLAGANVSVGVSRDARVVAACRSGKPAGDEEPAGSERIDGVPFARFRGGDAGAGSRWNWTVYRAVRAGTCYEIVEWLSWGAIDNYPAGAVREFDRHAIDGQLHVMTRSFRFEAQGGGRSD